MIIIALISTVCLIQAIRTMHISHLAEREHRRIDAECAKALRLGLYNRRSIAHHYTITDTK